MPFKRAKTLSKLREAQKSSKTAFSNIKQHSEQIASGAVSARLAWEQNRRFCDRALKAAAEWATIGKAITEQGEHLAEAYKGIGAAIGEISVLEDKLDAMGDPKDPREKADFKKLYAEYVKKCAVGEAHLATLTVIGANFKALKAKEPKLLDVLNTKLD